MLEGDNVTQHLLWRRTARAPSNSRAFCEHTVGRPRRGRGRPVRFDLRRSTAPDQPSRVPEDGRWGARRDGRGPHREKQRRKPRLDRRPLKIRPQAGFSGSWVVSVEPHEEGRRAAQRDPICGPCRSPKRRPFASTRDLGGRDPRAPPSQRRNMFDGRWREAVDRTTGPVGRTLVPPRGDRRRAHRFRSCVRRGHRRRRLPRGTCCWPSPLPRPPPAFTICSTGPWPRPGALRRSAAAFFDSVSDPGRRHRRHGGVAWYLVTRHEGHLVLLPPGHPRGHLPRLLRAGQGRGPGAERQGAV